MHLLANPNPLAVLYIDANSVAKAQKLSQFVREQELEDPDVEPNWVEKGRTEIILGSHNPIFLNSYLFEAVNHERLIIKVAIYSIKGSHKKLKKLKHDTSLIKLHK